MTLWPCSTASSRPSLHDHASGAAAIGGRVSRWSAGGDAVAAERHALGRRGGGGPRPRGRAAAGRRAPTTRCQGTAAAVPGHDRADRPGRVAAGLGRPGRRRSRRTTSPGPGGIRSTSAQHRFDVLLRCHRRPRYGQRTRHASDRGSGGAAGDQRNGSVVRRMRDARSRHRGPAGRGQGRLVVADHGRRRARPGAVDALVDALGRRTPAAAGRSCWSPPAPSPPGWPRSGCTRRPRDLATQQAAASVGPGAADARLHRGVRPARPHRRAGAAHRRRRDPAGALPQRVPHPAQAARPAAPSRSSTRTTPWPPRRSGSATTTGSPRWSPPWSTPTCWCCCPTWTRSTPATRRGPASRRIDEVARRRRPGRRRRSAGPGRAGVGTGGMVTKVEAARIATGAGIPVVLTAAAAGRRGAGRRARSARSSTAVRERAGRPAVLAGPRHHARAAGCTSTPARSRAVVDRRASLLPAGITARRRRVHRRRPGRPGRRRRARRWPAGWSTTTRSSCPACSAAPPATRRRARPGVRDARSSTATTWSCSETGAGGTDDERRRAGASGPGSAATDAGHGDAGRPRTPRCARWPTRCVAAYRRDPRRPTPRTSAAAASRRHAASPLSTGCALDPSAGGRAWPTGCARWPGCPTRSARWSAARPCPTAWSCARSGCRSAWSASSTRPART